MVPVQRYVAPLHAGQHGMVGIHVGEIEFACQERDLKFGNIWRAYHLEFEARAGLQFLEDRHPDIG
jgi:hypothetical protein